MPKKISLDHHVTEQLSGMRLDQVAAVLFPDYSRARLQQWIKKGDLTVNGARAKPSVRLAGGEFLRIEAQMVPQGEVLPQDIPLDIIFEDAPVTIQRIRRLADELNSYRTQFARIKPSETGTNSN